MVQMSKKKIILSHRPEPPSVEQIVEDVESVVEDDVIFVAEDRSKQDGDSSVMFESFSYEDSPPGQDKRPKEGDTSSQLKQTEDDGNTAVADIDTVYKQAVQFIEITEKLKSAPVELRTVCAHLQKIGKEMTDSVEELKQQSDSVLKRTSC